MQISELSGQFVRKIVRTESLIRNSDEQRSNEQRSNVSFEVVSMFPSISKDVGLEQCEIHLDKRIDPLFRTTCILEALDITLSHNNITTFEEKCI